MENKTIDIEPRAAVEMQTWENIYDRVPSQYKQYVSYPTTTMQECPSKAEINDKLTHACTTDSNELAVTAMGQTTYIYLSQNASPLQPTTPTSTN